MIKCIRYKQINKGTLQGFFDIFIPTWGINIYGCALHMKNGKTWIHLPSKEYINDKGEKHYNSVILFEKPNHYKVFCEAAKRAIDDWCKVSLTEGVGTHQKQ